MGLLHTNPGPCPPKKQKSHRQRRSPLPNQLIPSQLVDFLTPRHGYGPWVPKSKKRKDRGESFYDIPVASMTGRCFEGTWDWFFRLPFMKPSWNKPYYKPYIQANMPVPWYGVPVPSDPLGFIFPNFRGDNKTTWTLTAQNRKLVVLVGMPLWRCSWRVVSNKWLPETAAF